MKIISGKSVSQGFAIGKIFCYKTISLESKMFSIAPSEVAKEKERAENALSKTRERIKRLIANTIDSVNTDKNATAIFEAYLEIATDPELKNDIVSYIEKNLVNLDTAVFYVSKQYIDDMLSLDDEYLRARSEDFKQIFRIIKMEAHGIENTMPPTNEPFIFTAKEIGPADVESVDKSLLLGIIVETGSKTSHAAILSRALGIPMISGIENIFEKLPNETEAAMDGNAGIVYAEPDEKTITAYKEKILLQRTEREMDVQFIDKEARTKSGEKITLYANIGQESDVEEANENKADGVGLFRTEFLFMKNGGTVLPSEESQFRSYKYVLEQMNGKPVIFRTLDAGGDKKIEALRIAHEENPFLGLRAIRFCLRNEAIFKTQLRAILRASVFGNALIMLPMIISASEIDKTKALIQKVCGECKRDNVEVRDDVPLGIMIETPAAAVTADSLAKEAAFFNIGTNDLTQYTLAVDRGNETISDLYDESHPAVLDLIKKVVEAGNRHSIPVDVCGEAAGNPLMTENLLRCGVRNFSMSAINIPKIKRKLSEISL